MKAEHNCQPATVVLSMEAYVLSGASPSLSPSLHLSLGFPLRTHPLHPPPPPPPPGRTPDRFTQLTRLTWDLPPLQRQSESCQVHLYADVINLKEKMCMLQTKGKGELKEGRRERREGVREAESVMPPACSLRNLSNLESCQDTARLCKALPPLLLACT